MSMSLGGGCTVFPQWKLLLRMDMSLGVHLIWEITGVLVMRGEWVLGLMHHLSCFEGGLYKQMTIARMLGQVGWLLPSRGTGSRVSWQSGRHLSILTAPYNSHSPRMNSSTMFAVGFPCSDLPGSWAKVFSFKSPWNWKSQTGALVAADKGVGACWRQILKL